MKPLLFAAALMLSAAAQAPAPAPVATTQAIGGQVVVITAQQVAESARRARAAFAADTTKSPNTRQPLLSATPYALTLEHRFGRQSASTHATDAELLFVTEGSGSVTTGGTLVGAGATNTGNTVGTDIENGTTRRFTVGDMILVPEGTPHSLSPDPGQALIVASMFVPRTGRFAPPATAGANPPKTFHAAADLPAMMATAKAAVPTSARFFGGDTIMTLPPYRIGLEYRSPKGIASVHTLNAEIMMVLEGEGFIEAGGTLVGGRVTGANVDGDSIEGGVDYKMKKGDIIFVPKAVPHLARSEGTFVLATMHLPAD
jgi:mannose-6-phosphate isomerase-like protein (cupin superfamily)